jgi:Flp pilus assembly protein TadG
MKNGKRTNTTPRTFQGPVVQQILALGRRRYRGQAAVIMTLVIGTLIGAMALSTDVGLFYFNWVQLQKAADSAALAGANYLTALPDPSGTVASNAVSAAKGYACLNGINDPNNANVAICPNPTKNPNPAYVDQISSVAVNSSDSQLTIQISRQIPYYFGRVLGLQSGSAAVSATAAVSGSIGTYSGGLFPAGIQCTSPCSLANLNPGQTNAWGTKFVGGLAPGNWGWLNLGQGTGASALGNAIANGEAGTFTVGQMINSSPGNKGNSNPVQSGFTARVNAHNQMYPNVDATTMCNSSGSNPAVPANDPLMVTVPAVDFTGCHGNCSMAIEGFVHIYLMPSSSPSEIDGCLVQAVTADSVSSSTAPQLGALAPPVLIQ